MRDPNGTARASRDRRDDAHRGRARRRARSGPSASPEPQRPAYHAGRGEGAGALAVGRWQTAPFRAGGVPHRRIEDWQYSDLRAALSAPAAVADSALAVHPFTEVSGTRLDISDGVLTSDLAKLPPTLEACDLSQLDAAPGWVRAHLGAQEAREMAAASLALLAGGVALRVKSGVTVEEPLHLNFVSSAAHHARVLVVLEDGASLTLLESHDNAAPLANLGVEIVLGEKAELTHLRLARRAETAGQAIASASNTSVASSRDSPAPPCSSPR